MRDSEFDDGDTAGLVGGVLLLATFAVAVVLVAVVAFALSKREFQQTASISSTSEIARRWMPAEPVTPRLDASTSEVGGG